MLFAPDSIATAAPAGTLTAPVVCAVPVPIRVDPFLKRDVVIDGDVGDLQRRDVDIDGAELNTPDVCSTTVPASISSGELPETPADSASVPLPVLCTAEPPVDSPVDKVSVDPLMTSSVPPLREMDRLVEKLAVVRRVLLKTLTEFAELPRELSALTSTTAPATPDWPI